MSSQEPPLQVHTFNFGSHDIRHLNHDRDLNVECCKTLTHTVNFKLTVQCTEEEIWASLQDFGGCYPLSSDAEDDNTATANESSNEIDQRQPGTEAETGKATTEEKPDLFGLDVWPAALELCTFLADHPQLVADILVIELGAGVGLPGLLAARLGASRVVLTYYEPQVVDHMAHNAALCKVEDRCSGLCLDWTKLDQLSSLHAAYPAVLAADVL